RETRYERYIRQLIDRYQLKDHVVFTGILDAEQMKEQYLKAHVFLSASSIENSPNSIGEAMILGTPVVASDVGGVSSMLSNEKEGLLYQADRVEDMAADIDRLFRDNVLARRLSAGARERARITHDPETNYRQLISIYEEIAGGTR
ncbi:MAG: glycosyltransferase family 4 protein, partial [Solobacterium sp.]|nr:glycosyltransferase family 4 protein [Solobacterium sp.]